MDTQSCGPDEKFARDLAELDRELDARIAPDADLADLMVVLAGLDLLSPDGCAEGQTILREIESKAPGTLARLQAGFALRRAGGSLLSESRLSDA